MVAVTRRLRPAHRFLAGHGLYPLVLISALTGVLFAGRVYLSRTWLFLFLGWNLILAWIPYFASLWAAGLHARHRGRWPLLIVPAALWLAFFPNAPYLVTDLGHLAARSPIPLWYDVGLLACFALSGLFLGLHSLHSMHRVVRDYVGGLLGWLFVLVSMGLGGLGVYLGRFLRWNSWDLVLNPRGVLRDVALRLLAPGQHLQAVGVTLLFSALLLTCYLILTREPAR